MYEPDGQSISSGTAIEEAAGDQQQSVADLVRQLTTQAGELARQEIELAEAELTEKGRRAGVGVVSIVVAALSLLFVLAAFGGAAGLALAIVWPGWAAALSVGGAYLIVALLFAVVGLAKVRRASPPVPEQAAENVQADVRMVKARAREARQ